jgi:transposase InsO family protein
VLGIEHRLTKPRTPQTNGMVDRFNGRISEVLKTHRFNDSEDLSQTLTRYIFLYNHHLPQAALKSKSPFQSLQHWYTSHPHLFKTRPHNHRGYDT